MPPKRGKEIPRHGRQLNIKCSPEFFELTEAVRRAEKLGLAECVRTLYLDQALRQIALAVQLDILTLADVETTVKIQADGDWAGLYKGFIHVLTKIATKDPLFARRYAWHSRQEIVDPKTPQIPTADVKAVFRKHNQAQEVFA